FVAGQFTSIGDLYRTNLAKLDSDGMGSALPDWKSSPSYPPDNNSDYSPDDWVMVAREDGLLVGNRFLRMNGVGGLISFAKLDWFTGSPDESVRVAVGDPGWIARMVH